MIGSQFACAAVKKGWVANCQGSSPLVDMYVYAADLRFSAVQALPTAYVPPPDLTRSRRRRRQTTGFQRRRPCLPAPHTNRTTVRWTHAQTERRGKRTPRVEGGIEVGLHSCWDALLLLALHAGQSKLVRRSGLGGNQRQ